MLAADAGDDVGITNSIFWNFSFSDNVRATIIDHSRLVILPKQYNNFIITLNIGCWDFDIDITNLIFSNSSRL